MTTVNNAKGFSWSKAEKAHPKKTASTTEMFNLKAGGKNEAKSRAQGVEGADEDNPFRIGSEYYDPRLGKDSSTPLKQNASHFHSQSMSSLSSGQASFRDLCPVDKERLSALIQQVAEMTEQKQRLEQELERERKEKEKEIKEMLNQQQLLLSDKEKLLLKFEKVHLKLEELKRQRKEEARQNKLQTKQREQPAPAPAAEPSGTTGQEKDFSPFKSSTPRSQSPRTISPIPVKPSVVSSAKKPAVDAKPRGNGEPKSPENTPQVSAKGHEFCESKKVDLIKQQMELVQEQERLRNLIEHQEQMLREKQEQIQLQQQLHRQHLERMTHNDQANSLELNGIHQQAFSSPYIQPPVFNGIAPGFVPQVSQTLPSQAMLIDMMNRMAMHPAVSLPPQQIPLATPTFVNPNQESFHQSSLNHAEEQKNRLLEYVIKHGSQMDAGSIESFNHLLLAYDSKRLGMQPGFVPTFANGQMHPMSVHNPSLLEVQQSIHQVRPEPVSQPNYASNADSTAPNSNHPFNPKPNAVKSKPAANLNSSSSSVKQDNDKFLLDMLMGDQGAQKQSPIASSAKKPVVAKTTSLPRGPARHEAVKPKQQQQQRSTDFFRKNTNLNNDSYQDQEDSQLIEEIFFLK